MRIAVDHLGHSALIFFLEHSGLLDTEMVGEDSAVQVTASERGKLFRDPDIRLRENIFLAAAISVYLNFLLQI